jgi:hypothetical protein
VRRVIACLGLLAIVLGWCIDEPLQQRVSYDKPAQTLKALLRDLSAQTNLKLYAAPPLDAEIVLVAVQEMPLKELMAHLAYVVDGEWIDEGEGQHRLSRTPKVIAKRRQEDREQTLAALRKMLASEEFRRYLEPLTREEVVERVERIRKQLRELNPEEHQTYDLYKLISKIYTKEWLPLVSEHRLLCRILQRIDLSALAGMPPWEQRVFSNVSGRYLLPLRVDLTPLLEQWFKERAILHTVISDPRYEFSEAELESLRYYGWAEQIRDVRESSKASLPERVYLVVKWYGGRNDFLFLLHLVDERNCQIGTGYYSGGTYWESFEQRLEQLSRQDRALVQPVEWREATQRWLDAWRALEASREVKPLPELFDPAMHEPLQFVATDVLRSYARHRNLSLVALLDDGMMGWVSRAIINRLRVADYLNPETQEIDATDTVVRIKPRLSSLKWRERENREAASRWIRQIVARGYAKLDDVLDAQHQPVMASTYLDHLGTDVYSFLNLLNLAVLPLLKTLLPSVETSADGIVELPLNRLAPKQIQELERVVYHAAWGVFLVPLNEEQDDSDDAEPSLIELPHAFLPNGIPRDAVLVCKIEKSDGILTTRSGVGIWGRFYDVAGLQYYFGTQSENNDYRRHRREFIQNSLLVPAQRQGLTLSLRVEPYNIEIISTYEVYGYRPTQGLKPIRWEQLPPEWLKPPDPQEASEDP